MSYSDVIKLDIKVSHVRDAENYILNSCPIGQAFKELMGHKKFSNIAVSELDTPSRRVRYNFDKPYKSQDFWKDKKLAIGKRRNKVLRTIVLTKYQKSELN